MIAAKSGGESRSPRRAGFLLEKFSEAIAAIIPITIGYFAGILYIGSYFSKFGISIHEISLDIPTVISYSFNVFCSLEFVIFMLGALAISITMQSSEFIQSIISRLKTYAEDRITHFLSIGFVSLLALLLIAWIARVQAQEDAESVWSGEAASIIFRAPISQFDYNISVRVGLEFQRCKELDQMRHILTTERYVYAACPATSQHGLLFIQDRQTGQLTELREIKR